MILPYLFKMVIYAYVISCHSKEGIYHIDLKADPFSENIL